ncbi:transcription factor HIVEP2 [Megalobrama amblycephala]|uniref:transcription factor HIVEP2 n=1 Tax=Megalobrama amblycephala TaxID=75352 RepID=UPI0020141C3E|nr:transcription factor HIVEP2 [Megalobrama amblycephala]XP_048046386.1 transcription factor HIVEP2 [Megalobrama amblycephala]XP_048046387.1 transcription factor HIVEP2 [Megalobrama amblycephala]XP_048046388.1 transcription factor HIVEP2 [Megalobrama amblycephala]XP_048046389.1 transcription factor HIVEP2 [Megalobrama amblycephala]XP_048046391.1 transcription factor HIVEP2 [Megalobrama amblycephala]XP_048046392.1 transcription factor HIVEP2 [Megalobrama amblycephala]XP_048046393.1 transcript
MEAAKTSGEAECSEQIISFKDDEKHLPSEMTQRGQSSGSEDKIRLVEQPQTPAVSPSPSMESQVLASGNILTSKSREQCHIQLRRKNVPLPNKRYLQSEYELLSEGLHKKEQKSVKTGKYVCQYCGRACAKPSVLKKHIRSHTGERPYPCIPCGFSFKTKSNLYKHRKSHTHAVKAGLVSFSEQDSKNMDEELTMAEGEMRFDAEQSSDTDEEVVEDLSLDTTSHIKDTEGFVQKKGGKLAKTEAMCSAQTSVKKETGSSGKVSLWQFREMTAPAAIAQVEQMVEFSSIKQRLALRLSEKKSQDSDQSLSLPSSYSKGSTDSGYFSRSESAEQQFNQSSASAKSYQEIMFGKCYKPTTRPKQSITVQTCMTDINEATSSFMITLNKGMMPGDTDSSIHRSKKDLVRSIKIDSESFQEEDYQECQNPSSDFLETASESSVFLRSNSLPTSSNSNLNSPEGLRSSNSFDERMTGADVTYRGAMGMRRLMRQAAFEHSANEGHAESDCYAHLACSLKSDLKIHSIDDSKMGAESCQETDLCSISPSYLSENSTRKRRKDKNVMEEEDFHIQVKPSGHPEEPEIKQTTLDTAYSETERRAGSNVISVIQHTNSLNRLNSSEKQSDVRSHPLEKIGTYKFMEKEHSMEGHRTEGVDWQWGVASSFLHQKLHMPPSQPSIQVPEIRVTVEPDRPEKVPDVGVKQKEKHTEEFQWPQRSETLSQFPMEKLPPKKKRLRLAEMECSSGESSFESACTSLSRSPSQDSNLSHSSSFSQSLDREETLNLVSHSNPDEFNKPLEFLSVPGSSQSHHREMRRSASEQAPYKLPSEVPEFRSKSFDYGSLSPSLTYRQEEVKERRRAFLVRQASLSGDPETQGGTVSDEMSKRKNSPSNSFTPEGSIEKMTYSLISGSPFPQHKQYSPVQASSQYVKSNVCNVHDMDSVMLLIKKEPEESNASESYINLRKPQEDCSQSLGNVLSTIAVLSQAQQALASQSTSSLLVPVRIQMQVPSYGNITYTSISHILDSQTNNPISCIEHKTSSCQSLAIVMTQNNIGCEPSSVSGHPRRLLRSPQASPAKLNTGIPLSLTSKTISTTEAPSGGANKRMLSPASSIELFTEAKQQKRVKDENIYGQIVEELSAVELGNLEGEKESHKKGFQSESTPELCEPTEVVDMDDASQDIYSNPKLQSSARIPQDAAMMECKPTSEHMVASYRSGFGIGAMPSAITGALLFSKFPGLHTTTCVSWCYLNSTKPNSTQTVAHFSEYASWFVRCHNPNPPHLSTGMVLALLRSKQGRQNAIYSIATMHQPGVLVTSTPWRPKQEQVTPDYREEDTKQDVRIRDISQRCKSLREDVASTIRQAEPVRVKIFEGGYKSNEEYVYVRGRGRGKYICEECGIRCKKPSMLKKHIRTHTDVRPYMCKCCNFAFKTKGNLTKHMKSKAHMKKCLELGVSPTAMDNTEDADDTQKSFGIMPLETTIKHQFSDVEDSDGVDDDEPDDDEDDECDGDSTPKTLSRSTSPQSYAVNKPCLSACLPKHFDPNRNLPKEQLEISSQSLEDDLTFEQSSSSFESCPPQLLSPCWDSPRQRYISPRGNLSPQRHPLSCRELSPLRAISPRRDLSIRGDFSPVRQLSPVRPTGSDPSGQRAQSPLGRQKGVLRAVSPRRGSYQHRTLMDPGRSVRFQASPLRPIIGVHSDTGMDQGDTPQNLYVPVGLCSSKNLSTNLQPDIFSHLPLHSQRQVPTPVPMIPIGGLRMPSTSISGAAGERNSLPSIPQGNILETASSGRTSAPVLDPGVAYSGEIATTSTGLQSKDDKKEESVYICAKAIASLRITSEDAADKPPKS